jgi:acyl-homoserine lactone acylase PvdQ
MTSRWKAQAARVTIIRDTWGVPHVYGKRRTPDAVFRLIYAPGPKTVSNASGPTT